MIPSTISTLSTRLVVGARGGEAALEQKREQRAGEDVDDLGAGGGDDGTTVVTSCSAVVTVFIAAGHVRSPVGSGEKTRPSDQIGTRP